MARYNVSSDMSARINLRDAAREEGRECGIATAEDGGEFSFSESEAREKAETAFSLAYDANEETQEFDDRTPDEIDFIDVPFVDDADEGREWYVEGYVEGYLDALRGEVASNIQKKLDLVPDELESLFGAMNSYDGNTVANTLAARYGLAEDWRFDGGLGRQLAAKGILTEPEGVYLDDAD